MQVAQMEVDFLSSLHAVRRMAIDVEELQRGLLPDGGGEHTGDHLLGAAARARYQTQVSERVAQLVAGADRLCASHDASVQVGECGWWLHVHVRAVSCLPRVTAS